MPVRKIEIDDDLQERIKDAIDELKDWMCDQTGDFEDLKKCDKILKLADSETPICTGEIQGLWYLYKTEFIEAYENAGLGDNPFENDGMTAIYCYIQDKIWEWWYSEAKEYYNVMNVDDED